MDMLTTGLGCGGWRGERRGVGLVGRHDVADGVGEAELAVSAALAVKGEVVKKMLSEASGGAPHTSTCIMHCNCNINNSRLLPS